jgi:hypothetical protein
MHPDGQPLNSRWGEEQIRAYLTAKFDQVAASIAAKDVEAFYQVMDQIEADGFPGVAREIEGGLIAAGLRRLADRLDRIDRKGRDGDPGE